MSKNLKRTYFDRFWDEDAFDRVERLKHKVKNDDPEKERTLLFKKVRQSKNKLHTD